MMDWYYLSVLSDGGTLVWVTYDNPITTDLMSLPHASDMFIYKNDRFDVLRDCSGILQNKKARHALRKSLRDNMTDPDGGPLALSSNRCPELAKHMKRLEET